MTDENQSKYIYTLLSSHKSIRQFKSEPVPQDTMDKILMAACQAPTGGNLQSYSIIATTDEKRRQLLSQIHFAMPMIRQAPVVMTFCADVSRNTAWAKANDSDLGFYNLWGFYVGLMDAISCAQNTVILAEAEGLGTCHSGATFQRALSLIDFFKCPRGVIPVATLAIGYPAENPEQRNRLPLKAVVMRETYEVHGQAETKQFYKEKEIADWRRYAADPEMRTTVRELGLKHLAQIYAQVKYRPEDNEMFSDNFMTALKKQGFVKPVSG